MYLTWKEQHIAVNTRLQEMMGNRELVVKPQEIDLRLNRAQRKFIDTRVSKTGTIKKEGFEDTGKRYDDLRELKVRITLPCFDNTEDVYSILPKDYLHLINDASYIFRTCNGYTRSLTATNYTHIVVPFPTDVTTGIATSYYTTLAITVNGASVFNISSYPGFLGYTKDSKFMFVELVKSHINNAGIYECYWEKYGDVYAHHSFIIVAKPTAITAATLGYLQKSNATYTVNGTLATVSRPLIGFVNNPTPIKRPNSICDTEYEQDLIVDPDSKSNRWESPLSSLYKNMLIVYKFSDFSTYRTSILYLREPRVISSYFEQSCELNSADEIVDIAVQDIYADISNPNYRNIVTENLTKE